MISEWVRLVASGAVLLEGFHSVKHALRFDGDVPMIVTADRALARLLAETLAPDLAATLESRLVDVDAATFGRLVPSGHHTEVAGLAMRPTWPPQEPATRTAPLVFLDNPRHLGNYGAVIRVAAGLGASGVVSVGPVDPWQGAVVRGAAGRQFALPVQRVPALSPGFDGPVLAFDGGGRDVRMVTVPDNAILAFGSERRGLSAAVRARADDLLALPMRPGVASYNLASAVAMALYHWTLGPRAS